MKQLFALAVAGLGSVAAFAEGGVLEIFLHLPHHISNEEKREREQKAADESSHQIVNHFQTPNQIQIEITGTPLSSWYCRTSGVAKVSPALGKVKFCGSTALMTTGRSIFS